MHYQEAVRYLESFVNYEKASHWPYKKSLKLQRFKEFLVFLGNPQQDLSCLHVAGTKGKGSVCAFLAYILKEAGFKVGLYTSPHLFDFRERIRILLPVDKNVKTKSRKNKDVFEGVIPKKDLVSLVQELKPKIEIFNRRNKCLGELSFFEVYTALAFLYFKKYRADFVVLETGLGGRLDATNTVSALVSGITPISYDHMQKLGKTLREIAQEKAGIIKLPARPVISAVQPKEAQKVIRERAGKIGAKLYEVGRDLRILNENRDYFTVKGIYTTYRHLKTRLLGYHQRLNATLAIGMIEALRSYGVMIGSEAIRKGLLATLWPGRCEVMQRNPLIVLDGAQNVASSLALRKAIKDNFLYRKLILILGISKDKDIRGICRILKPIADKIVLTRADNPRAVMPEILVSFFSSANTTITHNSLEALNKAKDMASSEDLILVTGSLFLVGEVRAYLMSSAHKKIVTSRLIR